MRTLVSWHDRQADKFVTLCNELSISQWLGENSHEQLSTFVQRWYAGHDIACAWIEQQEHVAHGYPVYLIYANVEGYGELAKCGAVTRYGKLVFSGINEDRCLEETDELS